MTHKKPVTIRWWIGQLVGCGDHFTMCIYTCIYQNQVAHIKYITIYKCQLHPEKINLRKLCLKKKSLTSKVSQNCIIWNFNRNLEFVSDIFYIAKILPTKNHFQILFCLQIALKMYTKMSVTPVELKHFV